MINIPEERLKIVSICCLLSSDQRNRRFVQRIIIYNKTMKTDKDYNPMNFKEISFADNSIKMSNENFHMEMSERFQK